MSPSRGVHVAGKRIRPLLAYERLWNYTKTTIDDNDDSSPICFSKLIREYTEVPNNATMLLDCRIKPYIKRCSRCGQTYLHVSEHTTTKTFSCEEDADDVLDAPSGPDTVLETKKRYPLSSTIMKRLRRAQESIQEGKRQCEYLYENPTQYPNTLEDCFGWDKWSCYCTTHFRLIDCNNFVTTVDQILQQLENL